MRKRSWGFVGTRHRVSRHAGRGAVQSRVTDATLDISFGHLLYFVIRTGYQLTQCRGLHGAKRSTRNSAGNNNVPQETVSTIGVRYLIPPPHLLVECRQIRKSGFGHIYTYVYTCKINRGRDGGKRRGAEWGRFSLRKHRRSPNPSLREEAITGTQRNRCTFSPYWPAPDISLRELAIAKLRREAVPNHHHASSRGVMSSAVSVVRYFKCCTKKQLLLHT